MSTRKVQLWRFVDADDQPTGEIPASALHRFLGQQEAAGVDLSHEHPHDYRTQIEVAPSSPHLIFHRLRDSDLPSERRNGKIVALNSSVAELAEGSHALLLPRNLMAFVGSGFSPRPGRLAEWMRARLGWDVWLQPVLRHDLGTVLDHIRKVSNIELAIPADEVRRLNMSDFFEDDDDPLRVLQFAEQAQQGGIIRVGWSVGQGSSADQGWFRNLVARLGRADLRGFSSAKSKVYVEGEDGAVPLDFLHDRVVAEFPIEDQPTRQRTLPSNVAHALMREAWDHFRDDEKVLDYIEPPTEASPQVPQALLDQHQP